MGAKSNILSDYLKHYHSQTLLNILKHAAKEVRYTHAFELEYCLKGKANRPFLRKCLRTLEADGLIENINLGYNIHQWKITDAGKAYLLTRQQTEMEAKTKQEARWDQQMNNWLDRLEKAISDRDRSKILGLYDENIANPFWVWDAVSSEMQERYEDLTEKGNSICYGY